MHVGVACALQRLVSGRSVTHHYITTITSISPLHYHCAIFFGLRDFDSAVIFVFREFLTSKLCHCTTTDAAVTYHGFMKSPNFLGP